MTVKSKNYGISLQLLRSMIDLKISSQFYNQPEAKPKPIIIAPCMQTFPALVAVNFFNSDWFVVLFAPAVVIGWCNNNLLLLWYWFWDSHFKLDVFVPSMEVITLASRYCTNVVKLPLQKD